MQALSLWRARVPSAICQRLLSSVNHGSRVAALTAPAAACCQRRQLWGEGKAPDSDRGLDFYDHTVEQYALQPIERLSLQQMLEFGRRALHSPALVLASGRNVQRELPKRLARRLMDLQFLPFIVVTNPHIRRVYDAYWHAFNTMRGMAPVRTQADNAAFTSILQRLVDEHAPMLDALAAGLRECNSKPFTGQRLQLDSFLENMLRSRISRRVIAEHHIHLNIRRAGYIGAICTDLALNDATDFAFQRCRQVCSETYGRAPDVVYTGDVRATIPYIPVHLDYMLYELLKNSMRAVVEHHPPGAPLPPVLVHIAGAPQEVTIRISDQGGGIAHDLLDRVWRYGYTTINANNAGTEHASGMMGNMQYMGSNLSGGPFRMGGLGFGLPLSRLYARYFGGDLRLLSMPGYGMDAFLSLKRLEDGANAWRELDVEVMQSPILDPLPSQETSAL